MAIERRPHNKKAAIDVIDKILDACYKANPDALFIMSLMHQYEERGSLSKKQLQGLYLKASDIPGMPAGWLGSLEAIILKMPTRDKTPVTETKPLYAQDEQADKMMTAILEKYPQHKRVLFLKVKYDNKEVLSPVELGEIEKFHKMLSKPAR